MGHMEEAPARRSYGQEGGQEAVGSLSLLMMIREVGLMEVDILVRVVVVSCLTMKAEGHQAVVGMKVAAHLVQVVGF
jgi:hypothetical protein